MGTIYFGKLKNNTLIKECTPNGTDLLMEVYEKWKIEERVNENRRPFVLRICRKPSWKLIAILGVCVCVCIYVCVSINVCIYLCMFVYVYIGTLVYMYACMFRMYTNTHTHKRHWWFIKKKTKLKNSKSRHQKKETISFRTRQVIIARW